MTRTLDAPADDRSRLTLVDLLCRTAERHPDSPAVTDSRRTVSYAELIASAHSLAALLIERGVKAEDRVGLYLPRSADTVTAVMGILLAGAAYVPVDDRYPARRRDQLLADADVTVVVTAPGQGKRLERLPIQVLEWPGEPAGAAAAAAAADVAPGDAACVLFTSGSTGAPKGVVLEHRQLVGFALDGALPELGRGHRVAQHASISFDTFTFEVWRSIAGGAEIVVVPSIADLIGADIGRELRRRRITAMLAPATALNHIVVHDREAFSSLRVLCSGGDVLHPGTCQNLLAGGFSGQLFNLYGPTETTVACAGYRLGPQAPAGTIPIGYALEQSRLYVLDDNLAPVPDGTPGELYVGGPGLSRGYLRRPALTAARFVANPFSAAGERMYATGDRVVRRADGALDFLGRIDGQLKISGHRVEPAEVERLLCAQPDVIAAAVLAVGTADQRRLVAFVVPAAGGLVIRELRRSLARSAPRYLMPAEFVVIDQMPMDAHGKRDWEQLRRRWEERRADRRDYVTPSTDTEQLLARYWEDLLAQELIGALDDFFALGGHSMLAVRLRVAIKRDLGLAIPPEALFENSVLRDQAAMLTRYREGARP